MKIQPQPAGPRLLMVSHCYPDPLGDAQRARAWQLLRLVSGSYRVQLMSLADGPVNLDQWRRVQAHVDQQVLAPIETRQPWIRRWGEMLHPNHDALRALSHRQRRRLTHALKDGLQEWSVDVVLCTQAQLLACVEALLIANRVCDSGVRWRGDRGNRANHIWFEPSQRRIDHGQPRILSLTGFPVHATHPRDGGEGGVDSGSTPVVPSGDTQGHAVVLPPCVDLDYFAATTRSWDGDDPPRIAVHADWSDHHAKRSWGWFKRRVWPRVERVMRHSQCESTQPGLSQPAGDVIRGAWAVAVPGGDPRALILPVLQAMAMRKVVIVEKKVGEALGLHHGREAFLARDEREWAALCVRAIESPHARFQLSAGSWRYVREYGPDETAGQAFAQALSRLVATRQPLRLAA